MFISFGRILKNTWKGIYRNLWVSLATLSIIMVALFIIGSLILFNTSVDTTIEGLRNKINATIYFEEGVDEEYVLNIQKNIAQHEKVIPESVAYTAEVDILKQIEEREDELTDALIALEGTNPLGAEIKFAVVSHAVADYELMEQYIKDLDADANNIQSIGINDRKEVIQKINTIAEKTNLAGTIFIVAFIIFVFFVTYNTIRLSIYTASDEIHIMKLVGASNWFVRGPFIFAGICYGIFSSIVIMGLLLGMTKWLGANVDFLFAELQLYSYMVNNLLPIYGILLGTGVGLGVISSYVAVRRYLKV